MDNITQQKLLYLVKRNYDEIAGDFNETRNKALWPELVKLALDVKDGESVLDAGCGNGRLVKAFVERNVKYLGVDNNQNLVDLATSKFSIFNSQFSNNFQFLNFQFLVGDILELEKVVQDKFDWVFCIAVLHHLPGLELRLQALEQLKARLKPNGKIVLTVWNLWPQNKFRKLIWKNIIFKLIGLNKMDIGDILFPWKNNKGEIMSDRYYHAFTMNELKKLARRAGLSIEKIYKDKCNYYLVVK